MNTKEDAILYPVSYHVSPLLRHPDLIKDYKIQRGVCPPGFMPGEKDLSAIDNGTDSGILIYNNFQASLPHCETVIFSELSYESFFINDYRAYTIKKMSAAIKHKKNIACLLNLDMQERKDFEELGFKHNIKFDYLGMGQQQDDCPEYNARQHKLFDINVPVLFVFGITEYTNKFEVQLTLREQLLKQGYKVSQVGSKTYCSLFDFQAIPRFMYSSQLNESDKITEFNHFIKNIEITDNPDLIIIGIPGGIMPLTNDFTNYYGMTAYEIANAVTPDAAVFCLLYDKYTDEYLFELQKIIKYKFNIDIDCFSLGNHYFEWSEAILAKRKHFSIINYHVVEKKKAELQNLNIPVFNVYNSDDSLAMSNHMIDRLHSYGCAQIV